MRRVGLKTLLEICCNQENKSSHALRCVTKTHGKKSALETSVNFNVETVPN